MIIHRRFPRFTHVACGYGPSVRLATIRPIAATQIFGILFASGMLGACSSQTPEASCTSQPSAYVSVSRGSERVLDSDTLTKPLNATVNVGDEVSVRFDGPCLGRARLAVNDTEISHGAAVQTWSPTKAGSTLVSADWACSGPIPCPLGLGRVLVFALATKTPSQGVAPTPIPSTLDTTGYAGVAWHFQPGFEPSKTTEELYVAAFWRGCANGVAPVNPRPVVSYSRGTVTLGIWAVPPTGLSFNCPGGKEVDMTIPLSEPVGPRVVLHDVGPLR